MLFDGDNKKKKQPEEDEEEEAATAEGGQTQLQRMQTLLISEQLLIPTSEIPQN